MTGEVCLEGSTQRERGWMGPDRHASVKETTAVNQKLSGTDEYIKIHCGHIAFLPPSTQRSH